MTRFVNFITVLLIVGVIAALVTEKTMESVAIPTGFYTFSSFTALFTVGYNYYFELDRKYWGLSLMALTIGGILLTIVLMLT